MQPVKNITAMQELLDFIKSWQSEDGRILCYDHVIIDKATELLARERSQIVDAFNAGYDEIGTGWMDGSDYFTESFKQ